MKTAVLSVILLFAVAGCVEPSQAVIAHAFPFQKETLAVQVPVHLYPDSSSRIDSAIGSGPYSIPTGEIFSQVFNGNTDSKAELRITHTESSREMTDVGYSGVFTFHVEAELHVGNDVYTLAATGSEHGERGRSIVASAQIACERAAVDLAQQCAAVLKR